MLHEAYEYIVVCFFCGMCIRVACVLKRLDEGDRVPRRGILRQRDGNTQLQGVHGASDGVHQAGPTLLRHLPGHAGAMLVLGPPTRLLPLLFVQIVSIGLRGGACRYFPSLRRTAFGIVL